MTGLLDMLQQASNDPAQSQGILRFGLSLLASKGNFGNAVGQAGLQGLQGAQDYRNQQFQRQIQQSQLDQIKRQKTMQDLPGQFVTGGVKLPTMDNRDVGQPGEQAIPEKGFDFSGYTNSLMGLDPMQGLQMQAMLKKDNTPIKLGAGDKLLAPDTYRTLAENPKEGDKPKIAQLIAQRDALPIGHPNRAVYDDAIARETRSSSPSAIQEYEYARQQGETRNFTDWQAAQKRAGASNTSLSVNTAKPLLTNVAEGLGKQIDASLSDAKSAVNSIQTAQTLRAAVDSGKIAAGPGASWRVLGLQIGQQLGVGGRDSAEVLANTRTAIQSMAKAELDAASMMKGQGQITEAERDIIRRAAAGDIDKLTQPEILLLADSMEKTGRGKIKAHQKNLEGLKSMPDAAPLLPFYQVNEPAQSAPGSGVRRYNPATGRIE